MKLKKYSYVVARFYLLHLLAVFLEVTAVLTGGNYMDDRILHVFDACLLLHFISAFLCFLSMVWLIKKEERKESKT